MSVKTALNKAIKIRGKIQLAKDLGISYQSMNRWFDHNELPATDFNGKTFYALRIQEVTEGKVTITDLLGFIPHPQQWAMDKKAS